MRMWTYLAVSGAVVGLIIGAAWGLAAGYALGSTGQEPLMPEPDELDVPEWLKRPESLEQWAERVGYRVPDDASGLDGGR